MRPGEIVETVVPVRKFAPKAGVTYMLNVYAHEAADLPYADAGHVNSSEQFVIRNDEAQDNSPVQGKSPLVVEDEAALTITAGKVTVKVDKATGCLAGYHDGTRQVLKTPFVPNFWRAETDNDWRGWKPSYYLKVWKDAAENLSQPEITTAIEDAVAVVTARRTLGGHKAELTLKYSVYPDGSLNVAYDVKIADDVLEPLRIGLQGQIDGELDDIAYFGRGPHENYSDRNDGIFLGLWKTSPEDMMYQYVYPQENGNRTDVRWISCADDSGNGVVFVGDKPLSVSAWNVTQAELQEAMHIGEADVLSDSFVLNIDHVQTGVGGTDSWSQRARPYDQYRLLAKNYSYGFWVLPVKSLDEAVDAGRKYCR
jgi:beta-galactosidase